MNPTLASSFEKLTFAIKSNNEQSVKNIDISLKSIAEERDPVSVAFLLLSLEDDFQFDEGMFSVIHTAETFDDREYVAGFLNAIPHMLTTAPKWASIVLTRILNSEETKRELIRALVKSNASIKKSVEDLCNRINDQGTDFLSKTVAVLVATK
ncbi:Imm30 family immunity protein [Duganella sp. CF517]|uniref:Imm30 family immunity protein n=1 Tax=Duganella sp. CF517 TaxID=1881038 RepID=UPI000B7CDBCB|nr:Imm30 family immunity protein [Duganella sp. CF517]